MARVSDTDVIAILECDSAPADLRPYIQAATLLTDRVKTCAANKGITLTSEELASIELWLAGWYATTKSAEQRLKSKRTLSASGSWEVTNADSFLEAAKSLDPSGCLAGILEGKRAQMFWLGRKSSCRT